MPRTSPQTTLSRLAEPVDPLVESIVGDGSIAVSGLAYDSGRVRPGDLFFCIPGRVADGHDFAPLAVAAGAVALCVERPLDAAVPQVVVRDARRALALVAAEFYGRPADDLLLLGVTGTNGKTTTAYLLESILAADGRSTGLIGTIETRIGEERRPGVRTTPESLDLHELFAEMVARSVDACVMEVTSHALVLHRVDGVRFHAAGFTNLSQDHLDFHAGMEDYFAAKRSLFVPERIERGAVNVDDPFGRRLYETTEVPCVGFGLAADASVRVEHARWGAWGSEFVIVVAGDGLPRVEMKIESSLVGAFNVSNCLAACAISLQAGIDPGAVEAGLRNLRSVPGRFEALHEGQDFGVVVDYAHTPDSLDNVLREARRIAEHEGGRVVCVFGCGGDRDRGKRPLMGGVAARLADVVVVTSDNPRSERPRAIIDQILEGVVAEKAEGADAVIEDRAEAIARALELARPADMVVIAGKGHETGQELADRIVPFDDREVARAALRRLDRGASS